MGYWLNLEDYEIATISDNQDNIENYTHDGWFLVDWKVNTNFNTKYSYSYYLLARKRINKDKKGYR